MNANSTPGKSSKNRAPLPGWVLSIFHLLRLFWLFELALLIVVVYGQIKGWSTPRQWSDAFFFSGALQIIIAGVTGLKPPSEAYEAATLRYVPNSSVPENRWELVAATVRIRSFGLRAVIGGLLTMLIAAVFLWV